MTHSTLLYQTHARIHLQNIRANIRHIRDAVGAGRKMLIAVKADAYGHGAVAVSRMAERIGVDWLGVATVPEGIELRNAGIRLPILKLSHGFAEELEAALTHDLTLCVSGLDDIRTLCDTARRLKRTARVHLKVDTGMGRIGTSPRDAPGTARQIVAGSPHLELEGVFTHLPVSDEADTTFTRHQIQLFGNTVAAVEEAIGRSIPLVHCANSGGVLAYPECRFDMVRPGIMIYGHYPSPDVPRSIPLLPGLSFLTRVSFVKQVRAGSTVGYGRTWTAPEDCWIATFPAGYADGFNRLFSNTGRVLIHGESYPVAGRVCMDQSMVNLGPATDVAVGDRVVLIGRSGDREITVDEWARKLDTISYEVTCRIDHRVPRVYEGSDESPDYG